MEFSLSIFSNELFHKACKKQILKNFSQILIYSNQLSKQGYCELEKLDLKKIPKEKLVLVWDLLPDEDDFQKQKKIFCYWQKFFYTVRFQDPGVGFFLKNQFPKTNLEFNIERFSHNIYSIKEWQNIFLPSLKKIILSNLTPISKIIWWRPQISTKIEILGIGPLEIFYSPRKLLEKNQQVFLESTDRKASHHRLEQNQNGSIMYNTKDICTLNHLEKNQQAKIDTLRIEPYNKETFSALEAALSSPQKITLLAEIWPKPHLAGFFYANKTDAQFSMLKNKYLYPKDKSLKKVGKVIENKKKEYSLLFFFEKIKLPCSFSIYSTEKKNIKIKISSLKNLKEKKVLQTKEDYYFFDFIPNITPNSLIYK